MSSSRVSRALRAALSLVLISACGPAPGGGPALTPEERDAQAEAMAAAGKADGYGLLFFEATYLNLVLAGESDAGAVALVAGSHDADFPYWGTAPWDNALLLVEGKGYHFTERKQGAALALLVDPDRPASAGRLRFDGTMERAVDGQPVRVELELPVQLVRFPAQQLGKPYNFIDCEKIPGMRWEPFSLTGSAPGWVRVDGGSPLAVRSLRGELERGITANLRASAFAFAYDYVAVARAGDAGYAFVDFVSHPLYPEGALGKLLEWYLTRFASATLTLSGETLQPWNVAAVERPLPSDPTVVLFENQVDLGLARLRRQMIRTVDAEGSALYGLREIFERR